MELAQWVRRGAKGRQSTHGTQKKKKLTPAGGGAEHRKASHKGKCLSWARTQAGLW